MTRLALFSVAVAILMTGCYSESSLTKDEQVPDEVIAQFYLRDGSLVESEPGQHPRVNGGYQVTGEIFLPNQNTVNGEQGAISRPFTGLIMDPDIKAASTKRFDWLRSSVGMVGSAAVLYLVSQMSISRVL